jgi:protein TonB
MTCVFPAHEIFKQHYPRVIRAALVAAVVIHLGVFAFAPPMEFRPYRDPEPPDPPMVVLADLISDDLLRADPMVAPTDPVTPQPAPDPYPVVPPEPPIPFLEPGEGAGPVVRKPEPSPFIAVDRLPEPVGLLAPRYPGLAREAGIEGLVWIIALIGENGRVLEARVKKSHVTPSMERAALEAVLKARFKPALQGVTPVRARVVIPIHFRLH